MALDAHPTRRNLITIEDIAGLEPGDELVLLDYCPVPEGWAEEMGVDPALEERYADYRASVVSVSGGREPHVRLYLPDIVHEDLVAAEVFREMVAGGYVARSSGE